MTIELSSKAPADSETVELFSLDGKTFAIPARPRVNLALRYLKLARTQGAEQAGAFLLEELLGEDAYEALCDSETLTSENLNDIITVAQKVTLGGLDSPNS